MHGAVDPCQHLSYSGYLLAALELESGQPVLPARLHAVERSLPQPLADAAFADPEHPGGFPRGEGRSEQGHVLGRRPGQGIRPRLPHREVQTSLLQGHNLLFDELPAGIGCPPARGHLGDDVEHKASRLLSDVLRTPPYPPIPELLLRKLHSPQPLTTTILLTQIYKVRSR